MLHPGVFSVGSHNTDPLARGGSPCHHVHPWAPRGAQRLCQALLMPCPAWCWMQPGREPVVVTWLWGRPAPWQDPQNPTGSPFGGSRIRPTGCPWAHPLKDAPLQQQVKGGEQYQQCKNCFPRRGGGCKPGFPSPLHSAGMLNPCNKSPWALDVPI